MNFARKIASFVRWRLVPVRYLTMLYAMKWRKMLQAPPSRTAAATKIDTYGHTQGSDVPNDLLSQMQEIYFPRGSQVIPKSVGHPFVNLFSADDIRPDNPVMRYAFSQQVLEVETDYFGGRLILDSIQVLYSYPTEGDPRESQYWHLDYGDRKSFHCVAYLKDVLAPEDGPFVYVDKPTTAKIGRSLIVRRIEDAQFERELGKGNIEYFYGKAGSSVLVDPSACYHYGSRCKVARLAIFVTFSSWFPFAQPVSLVKDNAEKMLMALREIRPDLSEHYLKSLLQLA